MSSAHYKVQQPAAAADPRAALFGNKLTANNSSAAATTQKPLAVNSVKINIDDAAAKPDKVTQVTTKVNEIQSVLKQNLEMAIDRGETLNAMDAKAEQLMMDSSQFANKSRDVRRMMCKRNARFIVLFAVILAIVIGLIVWFASGSSTTTTTTTPAPTSAPTR